MNTPETEITGEALTQKRALIVRFSIDGNGKTVEKVDSLADAAKLFRDTIDALCVGASMVGDCIVSNGRKRIARVSYNGRVWEV